MTVDNQQPIKIGDILIKHNIITPTQLEGVLQESRVRNEKIGITLVRNDFCTENDIAYALSYQSGYEHIDLNNITVDYVPNVGELKKMYDIGYLVFKKDANNRILHIVISDPFDITKKKEIEQSIVERSYKFKYYVAPHTDIILFLKGYFKEVGFRKNIRENVEILYKNSANPLNANDDESSRVISKIFIEILEHAVFERVDDIHIEVIDGITRVKFKHGKSSKLVYVFKEDVGTRLSNYIRNKAGFTGNIMMHGDGAIRQRIINRFIDIRVSRVVVVSGENSVEESINMRILDRSKIDIKLNKLNMHPEDVEYLKYVAKQRQGLVVFYGPTGSGKTTTLYALLKEISSYTNKIVTVEDPVEYRSPTITQVQVNERAGITFGSTLRAFLRHAPDVILIGEIRDAETAQIALQAANTGHLVLTTVHATSADLVRDRLEKLGADVSVFDDVILSIIGQKRAAIFCEDCNERACKSCVDSKYKYQIIYEIKDFLQQKLYCDSFNKCKEYKRGLVMEKISKEKERGDKL
jgi:type IV pilus assembly protein PilB